MTLTFAKTLSGGRILPAAAVACLFLQASASSAQPAPSSVTVREERGVYTVAAQFGVDRPSTVALAVLMDYEQIPRFMPGVRTSIILEHTTGRSVVEQDAVSSIMMFSKRVHLVLEIDEQVDALLFRDRCGRSFARYQGAWRVSAENGRTTITYQLTAEPSFDIPGFVIKRLLRRDSTQMIERLKAEMASRPGPEPARHHELLAR
jgi:carbon monoxide dehydrogenase subunit G